MQKFLGDVNEELKEYQNQLRALYADVDELYQNNAPEEAYLDLLKQINTTRKSRQISKGAGSGWLPIRHRPRVMPYGISPTQRSDS